MQPYRLCDPSGCILLCDKRSYGSKPVSVVYHLKDETPTANHISRLPTPKHQKSLLWSLASVLGIAVLLERSVVIFSVWKLIGAAYLGYLGLRSLIGSESSTKQAAELTPTSQTTHLGELVAFRQGLLNNLLNPKAGTIFATVLPAFISPDDSPLRLGLMMVAYEAILLGWLNLYGLVVSLAGQSRLGTRIRTILQGVTGVVLIALGVRLAFEQK